MEIELKLSIEQVNAIMYALGELPIKSGMGQLVNVITSQVQPQLPQQDSNSDE